jgi:hypothetical protein
MGEGVKERVTHCLNRQVTDFYDEGILKLVHRLDKFLNRNGEYVKNKPMFLAVTLKSSGWII